MIFGRITHGLGNQLFQYALARNLALRLGTQVYVDLSYYKYTYPNDTPRVCKLQNFNIDYKTLNGSPLEYVSKATKLFPNRTLKPFFEFVKESGFNFHPEVLQAKSSVIILEGFWQSEKYFKENAITIKKDFTFKKSFSPQFDFYKNEILKTPTPISIHIRRGDYVNNVESSQTFGFIGDGYYQQAVNVIQNQFSDFRLFVFSDDKEWTKENFKVGKDTVYIDNPGDDGDIDDLHLMSLCKHHVIANSSFSWWGAWLSSLDNKLVIAPKNWFKNKPEMNTKDLIPDNWMKI